jgi:hypothetical protein
MIGETPDLIGATDVASQLGGWPSFHDAEVIDVHLVRYGQSTVSVKCMWKPARGAVVTFVVEEIADLDLHTADADAQNVIFDLKVEQVDGATKLEFEHCYGIAGQITAKRVSVRVDAAPSPTDSWPA